MQKVLIIGAGKCGLAILKIMLETDTLEVFAVADRNEHAPAMALAKQYNIKTGTNWRSFFTNEVDIVVEATGNPAVSEEVQKMRHEKMVVIPKSVVHSTAALMEEKEGLIRILKDNSYKHDLIFNSTHDGMIVIDQDGIVTLFNRSAERMTGHRKEDVLGKHIHECIPSGELPNTLKTKKVDRNQEFLLQNGRKIITSRIPMLNEEGELFGAFSVFRDITEVVDLAEELTNLKEIQTMLEAIIQSSEEAISVVDEQGRGILINPAYTRLTGLKEEEVIGKPAATDISEGESMHMKVLKTRRPVRGARMKVGAKRKDVIVNVAPVIVDGKLKGSVGVIHDMSEIQSLTNELNRARQIIRTLEAKYSFEDIIGTSEEFLLAIEQAKLAAKTPATVLLRGESGTGKELFAHAIHNASDRKYNKFVRVNCAALSESLLESELFGYEEGAFSGARRGGKRGLFEEANNGSIFLDEIGELSAHMQAKLLRVLQEHEIVRVGGTTPISINVRIIAATNVNLEKGMASGKIREDLYYRLNKIPIFIPSLRQRKEDIEALANHLIAKINQDYGRNVEGLTEGALQLLQAYHWPGNVRELENILGRAIIYMNYSEARIDVHHIPPLEARTKETGTVFAEPMDLSKDENLATLLERYEANLIRHTLKKYNGNKTKASRHLGVSIRSLYYKLEKYNIENNSMQ
jgi:PAS domain S-box-containing protein